MAGPAGAEGETAEPRKERSHTRRMRPPVRRNLQKSVLAVKEESTSKEAAPAAVRPKAPRMRQEPTQKAPEKEPVRRLTEQKKEKLPAPQSQPDHAKPASRTSRNKERVVSSDRVMAAFRRAADVSSWGSGVFTFHDVSGKHGGIVIAQTRTAFEPSYEILGEFSDGLALIEDKNRYGYINTEGKIVLPAVWDHAVSFENGKAWGEKRGKRYALDTEGHETLFPAWDMGYSFHEGLASVQRNGLYGFVDEAGTTVIEPVWEKTGCFHEGRCPVMKAKKWGYIDTEGKLVVPTEWDMTMEYSEGLGRICVNNRYGLMWRIMENTVLSMQTAGNPSS